jgi:endo-1,4-beta-xylanase
MNKISTRFAILGGLLGLLSACHPGNSAQPALEPKPALKTLFKDDFMMGVAINYDQSVGADRRAAPIIKHHFNALAPENVMKWVHIHPTSDTYDFGPADKYVQFGETNQMYLVGHTLVWHAQVPNWPFEGTNGQPADRATVLKRLHDHIATVVGRYKGRIKCWDVVNEALEEDGSLRQSPWLTAIGEDYIAKAFEYAHEADPKAILRYNDYSIENPAKRQGAIRLIKKLQAQHVPISGIGIQTHANLTWPSPELEDEALTELASLGLPLYITELDIDGSEAGQENQSADVAQTAAMRRNAGGQVENVDQKLANQYSNLFRAFLKHRDSIKAVTFWNVTDADSWKSQGKPLLFDENGKPKPAFDAVVAVARKRQ